MYFETRDDELFIVHTLESTFFFFFLRGEYAKSKFVPPPPANSPHLARKHKKTQNGHNFCSPRSKSDHRQMGRKPLPPDQKAVAIAVGRACKAK